MNEPTMRPADVGVLSPISLTDDEVLALLLSWRCCASPALCGARCMDDAESHRLAQFARWVDDTRARLAEVEADRDALRRAAVADRNLCYEAVAYLEDLLAGVEVVEDAARGCSARLAALGDRLARGSA